ncbi:winged helix-turn-helix domain-containing protein [Nanoarchaeota archaeon]
MAKKRERLEVINDILSVIRDNKNSIKPTRLLYASNLSPQMFKEYVNELLDKEFIEQAGDKKGKRIFSLTEKGFEFLEKYKTIVAFVDNFGL